MDFLSGLSFLGGSVYKPDEILPTRNINIFDNEEKVLKKVCDEDDGKVVAYTISFMSDGSAHEGKLDGAIFVTVCRTPNGLRAAKKIANLKFSRTGLKEQYREEITERLSGKNREGDVYQVSFMADGRIFEGKVDGAIYSEEVISKAGLSVAVKMAKKRFKRAFPNVKVTRLYRKNVRDLTRNIVDNGSEILYFIPEEGELIPYGKKVAMAMGTTYFVGKPCSKHTLNNIRYVSCNKCVLCKSKLNF